jgi:hypothetical protein
MKRRFSRCRIFAVPVFETNSCSGKTIPPQERRDVGRHGTKSMAASKDNTIVFHNPLRTISGCVQAFALSDWSSLE